MKKKLHHHFIDHLRLYRTFHFMFFTFVLLITSILIYSFGNKSYAGDLLEEAFKPAMTHETIVDLGNTKNAVGNEVLREGVVVDVDLGKGCDINGQKVTRNDVINQKISANYNGSENEFCENVLGGVRKDNLFQASVTTEPPLIVRIAKFLLRITMVLAITMVIFNGIMWIIESAKGAEVKDAKKNIVLIIVGVLIALMSLSIINLITSLTISSLNTDKTTKGCVFNNEILSSNNIKKEAEKYICSFNLGYKRDSDRISGNKCYKENTDKSECDQLGGNRGGGVGENSNNCYIEIISAEEFACRTNLGYKRDSDRISGNKCYKENTDKSECDQLGGNRGGGVGENSNNCYIEIRDIYLCDIFGGIYKN